MLNLRPKVKYFRYRLSTSERWLYAYIKVGGSIGFSEDWSNAEELSQSDIMAAFEKMNMRHGSVCPEQMTKEEFDLIRVMLS